MNIWHDIDSERIKPKDFISVIEITKGGKNKYELDKETGMLRLDRVLYTATHYPANYGFIPRTYADDQDPLDVLVLCQENIDPLTLVECYPIGVLIMIDSEQRDEKIIAVAKKDPFLNEYNNIEEIPNHISSEIKHFFEVYKQLEHKETVVEEILGREEAEKGKKRLADRIYRARMCACVTGGDPARYCTVWSCDRGSGMRGCTDRKRCRTGCQYCSSLPCSSNSFVCSWNIQYGTSTCRTDDDRHLLPMRGTVPALWLGTHQALCSCCTGSDQRLYSFDRYAISRKGGT